MENLLNLEKQCVLVQRVFVLFGVGKSITHPNNTSVGIKSYDVSKEKR